ncbi:2Fe-2S iron-sulfur cluster-binding protein [Bacillus sp. B15-48]|uniref:2Fe-2S iron-sulfur cluster-binding protein n=1 Tax=Bacillus sp. B15-48 TaxID=1548601 RepID=UPI00193FB9AD|nr:2Fe-2S iron-sulfur cluster-binding protein [Bacillus sp. B15-48]MBM4764605.1 2Fe-2S iron-sulfur cluster binding domain-containing protein [Bacillus sp. B15-48]
MPIVTVLGYGTFEVERGKKLVLALEDNGVKILHQCGGKAKCTTCRIEILGGEFCDLSNIEKNAFVEKGIFDDHLRLSCQVRVDGDVEVRPIMTVENSGMDPGPRPEE